MSASGARKRNAARKDAAQRSVSAQLYIECCLKEEFLEHFRLDAGLCDAERRRQLGQHSAELLLYVFDINKLSSLPGYLPSNTTLDRWYLPCRYEKTKPAMVAEVKAMRQALAAENPLKHLPLSSAKQHSLRLKQNQSVAEFIANLNDRVMTDFRFRSMSAAAKSNATKQSESAEPSSPTSAVKNVFCGNGQQRNSEFASSLVRLASAVGSVEAAVKAVPVFANAFLTPEAEAKVNKAMVHASTLYRYRTADDLAYVFAGAAQAAGPSAYLWPRCQQKRHRRVVGGVRACLGPFRQRRSPCFLGRVCRS